MTAHFKKVQSSKKLAVVGGNPYFSEYFRELKSTKDPRIQFLGLVLQELVASPATVQIYKKKARERVSRLFNWDGVTAQHERLYQDSVSRPNGR